MYPESWLNLATVGIEQSSQPHISCPPPLQHLLAQWPANQPEAKLLLAAAGFQLQQRAGYLPAQDKRPMPPPAAMDDRPICHPDAMRYLQVMLSGHHENALPEWFQAVAQQGQRIPPEALPLLLDTGRKQPDLQPYIAPLLGQRGDWLAQEGRSRKWDWLRLEVDTVWEEGKTAERTRLLHRLRQSEPERARKLLEATWAAENARTREEFLGCLQLNLSMADEPFLEQALDDRSKQVRRTALDLLACLPHSRFCQRMQARVTPLLKLERRGVARKRTLCVTVPETLTDPMKRDGIHSHQDRSQPSSTVETVGLAQMLSYIPPAIWCDLWQLSPAELLQAARQGKVPFDSPSIWGWASYRANDLDFMAYLLEHELKNIDADLARLMAATLPADRLETVSRPWLQPARTKEGLKSNHPAIPLLQVHQQPWSRDLTRLVLEALNRYLHRDNVRPDYLLRGMILDFAYFFPPPMKDDIRQTLAIETSDKNMWEDWVDEIDLRLDFRQKMLKAILRGQD